MPVPQKTRKNYIGLVNETTEEERLADMAVQSQARGMSYLISRLAAVLKRPRKAAPGRPVAP